MSSALPRALVEARYRRAAQAYMRSLPLTHFAQTTRQARQHALTFSTLGLIRSHRPDVHVFNELLIQFPRPRRRRRGRVVPDNMIVLSADPIRANLSFDLPLEPAGPFCVFDYPEEGNTRKDYDASFRVYERELKVPWCVRFTTDSRALALYRHTGTRYEPQAPNERGRLAIPELEVEMAVLDGWGRYWHRGELLLTSVEMVRELEVLRRARAELAARRAVEEENARLRVELERLRGQADKAN
jgi:hypothetical protein